VHGSEYGFFVHGNSRDPRAIADFTELTGKRFALVATEEVGGGAVFIGTARWDGLHLYWERSGIAQPIEVPEHRLKTVRRTTEQDREIIGDAEYLVLLTIGSLPYDEPTDEDILTGLTWPSE